MSFHSPNKNKCKINLQDFNIFFESEEMKNTVKVYKGINLFKEDVEPLKININDTKFFEFWSSVGYIINDKIANFMKDAIESDDIVEYIEQNKENMNTLQNFINSVGEVKEEFKLSDKVSTPEYYKNIAAIILSFAIAIGSYSSRTKRLINLSDPKTTSTKVIWKSINNYYKVMQKFKSESDVNSKKNNTADIVITNRENLLDFLKKNSDKSLDYDEETGIITLDNGEEKVQWAQISLKKGADEAARLGRVTTYVLDKYNIEGGMETLKKLTESENRRIYEMSILQEGVFEKIVGIGRSGKEIFNNIIDDISGIIKSVKDRLIGAYDYLTNAFSKISVVSSIPYISKNTNIPTDTVKKLIKEIGTVDLSGTTIQEEDSSVTFPRSKGGKFDKMIMDLTPEQRASLVETVNNEVDKVLKIGNNIDNIIISDVTYDINIESAKLGTKEGGLNGDEYRKIITNIISMNTLKRILLQDYENEVVKNSKEIADEFLSFQKEAIMGKTALPIIKVFGKDVKNINFDDESEIYTQEKISKMNNEIKDGIKNGSYPVGGIYINISENNGYFTVGFFGIAVIDEDGESKYYYYQMTTFSGSTFSYKIEAQSLKTQKQMEQSISNSSKYSAPV